MSARDIIATTAVEGRLDPIGPLHAEAIVQMLTAAGWRLVGPDEVALITTALEHASFALDGVVALDDEDEGKDGGSETCQHTKRTVDRALAAIRAVASGGKQ